MKIEYKVISERSLEKLCDDLNSQVDGWTVSAYTQEFGVTKILLQRDKPNKETP